MLAIAVHLNSRIVIVLPGIEITCLNRTADSQIDREINVVILILLTDLSDRTVLKCLNFVGDNVPGKVFSQFLIGVFDSSLPFFWMFQGVT